MKLTTSILLAICLTLAACNHKRQAPPVESQNETAVADTVRQAAQDTCRPVIKDTVYYEPERLDKVPASILALMDASGHKGEYANGLIPEVAKSSPEYARRLINSRYDKFIVVDKARMKVILYNHYGHEIVSYGMACAKNYGTKKGKADSRTPEGFFSVQGVYDSTDWLFTDDNGKTSKVKGQFGPRFIRLAIPGTSQIGIHGTCAPWSIGARASHGCIRVTNENIMQLVELVEPGMPVIVIPGKRDRKVNREEGNDIVYFPTSPKYAVSAAERREILGQKEETPSDTIPAPTAPADSVSGVVSDTIPQTTRATDYIDIPDTIKRI